MKVCMARQCRSSAVNPQKIQTDTDTKTKSLRNMGLRIIFHIIFLGVISEINCERWYSATILQTEPSELKDQNVNYIETVERYLPFNLKEPIVQTNINKVVAIEKNVKRRNFTKLSYNSFNSLIADENKFKNNNRNKKKKCKEVKVDRINQRNNQSKTRFLEVLEVVEFQHDLCTSSTGLEGTCLHEYECQSSGGIGMGSCADGYGTCCVTVLECDSQSTASIGWLTNPGFPRPSSERISCAIALSKFSEDIVQIRLDFTSFELLPPTDGVCHEDQFVISGQNVNNVIPILCGINTGQHVYVEVGESEGPIYFSIQTINPDTRLYSIKITQLTASDDLIAPPGCLQYYMEPEGYLESFNYRDTSDIAVGTAPSYLNNLNYAMCIERISETCSVTYTNVGYMQIVNYDTDGLPVIPPNQAGVEIFNCPSDWLLISATRLCGDRLNDGSVLQDFALDSPVTDYSAGPIVVWFRSDEGYVGRGFRLKYKQNVCIRPLR